MKKLIEYLIDDKLWNDFLAFYDNYENMGSLIKECKYIDFMYGNSDKVHILVDFHTHTLCCNYLSIKYFDSLAITKKQYRGYQYILRLDDEHGSRSFRHIPVEYRPQQAMKEMNKVLHKYYSDDEIDALLRSHEKENFDKQLHDTVAERGVISLFKNCYYSDINGAHTYILSEIFPKAEPDLRYWNAHKKEKNCGHFKKIPNFYVGILGKMGSGHRKTYNWIIGEVNRLMNEAFDETEDLRHSRYVYINTDGFIIQNPKKELNYSLDLGKFKLEYNGDVYTYAGKNYTIIQYGDTIKGTLPNCLRDLVDLRIGKVIDFDRVKVNNHYEYRNIKETTANVKIYQ